MAANPSLQFGFQSSTEPNPYAVDSPATLLIKHLPDAITHDTLSRILYCYGASSVRPCSSGRLKNCAFVDFKNDMLASQAQDKLNGLKFYGKVLSVERANKLNENGGKSSGTQMGKDSNTSEVKSENVTNTIDGDIKSGGLPIPEPIAHRLGVDYPFPPHLEYVYPPPDGNILTNIVNALIAVPRFYTQVLHLMNKMNIPAPFRMALPTPPLPPEVPAPPPPVPTPHSVTANPCSADMSSDESEMESSDEVTSSLLARDQTEPLYFLDPMYNSIKLSELDGARTEKSGRKRARRGAIVGPAIDKDVAHESVGVKPVTLIPKEIPMIKKNPVLKIKIAPKSTLKEHKDTGTEQELQELEKDTLDPYKFLTPDELEKGKLSRNDILSKFKNYSAGNPGPVLYIKNLHKDVIADDFYLLFGSLFGSTEAAKSELQIRLMQERRMRGQAFLTFPSTELAHRALSLVNGYVFKGNKPIIIQFGRKPTAAEGT